MAKLLTLLFEVTGLFDMRTRPELLMLQKTMVVVEGVARTLDPRLDIWNTAEPVAREWITRHLGPAGTFEGAARGVGEAGLLLTRIPGLLHRALRVVEQIDLATRKDAPETVAALGEGDRRAGRWGTIALWVIAALLAWGVFVK
jgi:ubiquinone biosynthesis protein